MWKIKLEDSQNIYYEVPKLKALKNNTNCFKIVLNFDHASFNKTNFYIIYIFLTTLTCKIVIANT